MVYKDLPHIWLIYAKNSQSRNLIQIYCDIHFGVQNKLLSCMSKIEIWVKAFVSARQSYSGGILPTFLLLKQFLEMVLHLVSFSKKSYFHTYFGPCPSLSSSLCKDQRRKKRRPLPKQSTVSANFYSWPRQRPQWPYLLHINKHKKTTSKLKDQSHNLFKWSENDHLDF